MRKVKRMKIPSIIAVSIFALVLMGGSSNCGAKEAIDKAAITRPAGETSQSPREVEKDLRQGIEQAADVVESIFSISKRTTDPTELAQHVMDGDIQNVEVTVIDGEKTREGDLPSLLELLSGSDGLRIRSVSAFGDSQIEGKVCGPEGVCIGFEAEVEQEGNGEWVIYDLVDVGLSEIRHEGRVTTSPLPSKVLEQFYKLVEGGNYAQALELFSPKVTTGDEIGQMPELRKWMLSILSSVDRVEVTYESTEERVELEAVVWKEGVHTRFLTVLLEKDQDGAWKIYAVRVSDRP